MKYELTKKEHEEAIMNYMPIKPIKEELGGDYYYRCPWLSCNKIVKKEWNACPYCAQRLDWEV